MYIKFWRVPFNFSFPLWRLCVTVRCVFSQRLFVFFWEGFFECAWVFFCIIKWKEMSVGQQIDGYYVLPHDTQLYRRWGRDCMGQSLTALGLLSICVWYCFCFVKVNSSVFFCNLFVCFVDRVDLGRMKRNFESSLICFLCFFYFIFLLNFV